MQYLTQPRKEDVMIMAQLLKAVAVDLLSDYVQTAHLNKPNDTRVECSIAVFTNRRHYTKLGT